MRSIKDPQLRQIVDVGLRVTAVRRSDNDDTSLESVVRFIGLGDQVSRVHNQRERVLARLYPSQAVQSVAIRERT